VTIDTAQSRPLGGVESLLEEARERRLLLVKGVSDGGSTAFTIPS
jgi:hypothetical protein